MSRHYGQMDQALWNAFLTAAGRASQLGRALQALKQMQVSSLGPEAAVPSIMAEMYTVKRPLQQNPLKEIITIHDVSGCVCLATRLALCTKNLTLYGNSTTEKWLGGSRWGFGCYCFSLTKNLI